MYVVKMNVGHRSSKYQHSAVGGSLLAVHVFNYSKYFRTLHFSLPSISTQSGDKLVHLSVPFA
jgi:hypothetical protein